MFGFRRLEEIACSVSCNARVSDLLLPLRVHVPFSYHILGPQSPSIGSTLRPKYSLFRNMDS